MADQGQRLSQEELEEFVREEISSQLKGKNLEHRIRIVEEAMSPLIDEVTTLSQHNSHSKKKKRKPQKLSKLIQLVDMATRNFLVVGEEIAHENPDFQEELVSACDEVRGCGEQLQTAAGQFSQEPSDPDSRSKMNEASKELLLSVTRLMVVADMVDVNNLLEASTRVERKLRSMHTATTVKEMMSRITECSADINYITQRAAVQPNDRRSEASLQLLSTTQLELTRAKRMLIGASKAFIEFPEARAARDNQEYVVLRLLDSLKTLSLLATGDDMSLTDVIKAEPGELAVCFINLKEHLDTIVNDPSSPDTQDCIGQLQKELNMILKLTSEVASSHTTRDYRQHSLITLCGQLKSRMTQLVTASREKGEGERLGDLATDMKVEGAELKKLLCRAAIDQVSDMFIGTLTPLIQMCETAQEGNSQALQSTAEVFEDHAHTLLNDVLLSCSLSEDGKRNQAVNSAAKNVRVLIPQVINSAYTLVREPSNSVALKSLSVFKETWAECVSALTDSVDAITSLDEFMAVTETHVCEDGQQFVLATEGCNTGLMADVVRVIRGRCKRLCHVVRAELKNSKSSYTSEQIHQSHGAMEKLMIKSVAQFCDLASKANEIIYVTRDLYRVDFRGLEEALQNVVDNVRNVRRSILVARPPGEVEGDESDVEDLLRPPRPLTPTPSLLSQISAGSVSLLSPLGKFQRTPHHSMVFEVEDSAQVIMAQLPQEQKAQLTKITESLDAQQAVFEAEVSKWDDSENDIVLLAKEMCGMMADMSDFTRGVGPLHSTMDVIVTARDIVKAAGILDTVARSIADHCPDPQCQRDIYSYLDQIRLYCHQLNITARVKADLKPSNTDTMDTVENAGTLITISRNLMNVVVQTVKTCYVASTAIARIHGGAVSDQFVQWRLTLPRKKKLTQSDSYSTATVAAGNSALSELGKFKQGRARTHNMPTLAEM